MGLTTCASILSAPFINPVRMVEKQQRAFFKQTGAEKPLMEIMRESAAKNFAPLFRGTIPLMGHSMASAILGLVGQPRLQKYVQESIGTTGMLGQSGTNLIASAVVSPIYVVVTNPLSRLEVIMQTSSMQQKSITTMEAVGEMAADMSKFGLAGVFRGQGIGIAKAIVSLTLFHEGRIWSPASSRSATLPTAGCPPRSKLLSCLACARPRAARSPHYCSAQPQREHRARRGPLHQSSCARARGFGRPRT